MRAPRWILYGSLALNLFLGAVVAVGLAQRGLGLPPPPPHPAEIAKDMAEDLPPADAERLLSAFSAREDVFNESHKIHRQVPARIRAALEADEVDLAALKSIFADARAARARMDRALEAAIVEAVAEMSAAGRKKLADWEPPRPPGR